MKRTLKKLIGLMLVFALLIVPAANTVTAVNSVTEETENPYNKLHFYLDNEENYTIDSYSELVQATASLKTNAEATYALTNTEDTAEKELQVTVEFSSDFMETKKYREFLAERETLETIDEVHEWRARLNAYSKQFHDDLVAKNMKTLSDMEYSDYDAVGYSPFVILKTSAEDINAAALFEVASCDNVEHVSVAYEAEVVEPMDGIQDNSTGVSWNDCLDAIGAKTYVNSEIYTGEDIIIGVYEGSGICDVTNINLQDKSIVIKNNNPCDEYGSVQHSTCNPDSCMYISEHATKVTSIIANIAPNANIFVSKVYTFSLEWFIDMACDVVNLSFAFLDNSNSETGIGQRQYRYDMDAIFDYQISTSFIATVISSGNYSNNIESEYNPYSQIASPGYTMNAITVGGANRVYGSWAHASYSCYVCPSSFDIKPNVVAPYDISIPNYNYYYKGTSYSAPMVTGCIALLLEKDFAYAAFPEAISALITATAQKTSDYSNDKGEFDERVGAGLINLSKMLYSSDNWVPFSNNNSTAGVEILSQDIYLNAGEDINIALSWLVPVDSTPTSSSDIYMTDYDLYLYNPSGYKVALSALNRNTEFIRTTAAISGTYRIVVYQYSSKTSVNGDYLALAFDY